MAREAPITLSSDYFTGEDKGLKFIVYHRPDGLTNAAFAALVAAGTAEREDITGWALSWMVKRVKTDPDADAILLKTATDGIALTTPLQGEVTVTLSAEDIALVEGELKYHHELKRTDVGYRTVLSRGAFILNQAVHDAAEAAT